MEKCKNRIKNESNYYIKEVKMTDIVEDYPFIKVSITFDDKKFLFKIFKDYPNTFNNSEVYLNNEKFETKFIRFSQANTLQDFIFLILNENN